jgi:hypothetical protein
MRWLALIALLLLAGPAWPHGLECPAHAPADWGASAGVLNGVQVLSAKQGEKIDDQFPPTLAPDDQSTRNGILHSVWQMNGDEPDWQFFVWCHYAGSKRLLKLAAPGVKRCEYTTPAAHPDRPPQTMRCD